jgi:hypothetical protein
MPIFMDRHELAGVSAADIAAAHLKDLNIQDKYGVKFLIYWFDERRGTAFCLIDAPDAATAQCVHREAHGFVAMASGHCDRDRRRTFNPCRNWPKADMRPASRCL